MVGLPTSTWITALLVFFAVALGTISVALVVELLQERKRQREALKQLRAFTNDEPEQEGILRLRSHELPRWFKPIAARVPAVEDIELMMEQAGMTSHVPMFLLKRGDRIVPNTTQTFRTFMREGKDGLVATMSDWETHVNTLFPEVRLKRILEIRGADAQSEAMCVALPALAKGLVYDDESLTRAESLASRIALDDAERARPEIAKNGLAAKIGARSVGELAAEVVEIAHAGLARLAVRDAKGEDETKYLAPLRALVASGKTPADALRERVRGDHFVSDVIAATRLR